MTTITKEEVKAFIEQIESDLANGWEAQIFELKLARIALASLEAEPIGAFHIADQLVGGTSDYIKDGEWPIDNGVIEVYAAPPATVVPEKLPCSVELKPGLIIGKGCKTETLLTALRRRADYYAKIDTFTPAERAEHDASIEAFKAMLPTPADSQGRPRAPVVPPAIKQDYKVIKSILPTANPDEYACCIAADMWNACRAAMLQGVEPVSNHDELALYYLQGQKDGLEWAAQLAEANHPLAGDWLYDDPLELAKAIRKGPDMPGFAGSSPVTPDGWISCSERMPDKLIPVMVMYEDGEMWSAMWNGKRWDDGTEYPDPHSVTHWREMPAAPQQEVK